MRFVIFFADGTYYSYSRFEDFIAAYYDYLDEDCDVVGVGRLTSLEDCLDTYSDFMSKVNEFSAN